MKIKVSDLTNEQLDEWVARAKDWNKTPSYCVSGDFYWERADGSLIVASTYSPTSNPTQWAELIEEFRIWLGEDIGANSSIHGWWAETSKGAKSHCYGPTPAIAICRAVVASVYGEYVETSDET